MSLDKAIASGKERRKPYYGTKAVDTSCRNHGSCDFCRNNRTYNYRKRLEAANAKLNEAIRHDDSNIACSGGTAAGDNFCQTLLYNEGIIANRRGLRLILMRKNPLSLVMDF